MSHIHHCARQIATLALAASLALPRHAVAETVDDTFLLTTSVSPNVLLILDNSAAMNQIEWHPAYDPALTPTCTDFNNTITYVSTALGNSETHCGNTRTIFKPNNPTLWDGRYLNWYFSDAADPFITQIETAVITVASCNQAGAGTRFVSQYRRTRADAARQVYFDVLCLSEPKGLRFGLAIFREPEDALDEDPNGGFVAAAVDDNTPAHAADLEAHIGNTRLYGATPLSETVFQLYTYLMSRTVANIPYGDDTVTQFPAYAYNGNGDASGAAGGILPDPVLFGCQKNFMIMVTSGAATRDDFDVEVVTNTAQGFANFGALIGDYWTETAPPSPAPDVEVSGTADERTLYLDDIAKYMQDKDLRPDFPDPQTVDLYTIGFGTTDAENEYLDRVAEVGNGLSFHVQDGAGLSAALVSALNDIVEKSRSFTAATVPSARTADGGDFYNSFFLPSGKTAFWEGHLRAWHFSAAGEILDSNGDCALVDPDGGGECNNGPFQTICQPPNTVGCVVPFWDAGDEMPPAGSANVSGVRQLFASKLDGSIPPGPVRTDVDAALTAADLKIQTFALPPSPAPNSPQYTIKGSDAINAEGLADEVVAFARGCFFGTGVQTADVLTVPAGGFPCEERPWLLGDIFHSDPIVVRNPPDRNLGSAYDAFRAAYLDRDRVIFTGTNGGYLEAFHAGDWDGTNLVYDEGTGVELFGFMPWEPRTKIKNQPIDDPANRTHYVDGAPQVADAWLYSTATVATQADADWRTVLVGGLREGGRHYYALDVTNPSGTTGPAGNLPYPGLLWEFPNENDANSGTGDYQHMGQTWGQAVLTRVRLNVGGNDNGGQGFERWVAIVAGGYDVTSDPNPATVDPSDAYVAGSTKGRAIYMLDLKTGRVLAQQKVGFNADENALTTPENGMLYSLLSTPAVLDLDADGFGDLVYIGDLGGNLWKWVIQPIGEDRVNDASGLRTQPAWKFQKIFQASTDTISGDVYYKNIFQPPAAAYVGNKLWIGWGTGERAAIGFKGITGAGNDENNRFYAITDPDPLAANPIAPAVLTEAGLTNITTVGTPVTSPRGYYFITPDGEKFVTTTVIFAGKVITASFTPSQLALGDPGFDPCTQRGNGQLYIFDLASGYGEFVDGANNETRSTDIGSGLPTDPKISIGVGGSDNKIVIQKSGTDIEILDAQDVDFGRGIIYWREMH